MNIVMFSNSYTPMVGGVARSVAAFAAEYRRCGHRVLVVAPAYAEQPADEADVVRIPAFKHFHGSDFSAALPLAGLLSEALDAFAPELVHAHHPYLLGMTALRVARWRGLPLVLTHHTLYEHYTHYTPVDSPAFRRFIIELATRYANLCDRVFAPSASIAALLRGRGVEAPIAAVPTGVDLARFAQGDGAGFRAGLGIPANAFVVGHLGRLAAEKNLPFLAEAVAAFLAAAPRAHFLLAGEGPMQALIRARFVEAGLAGRLHLAGILEGGALVDAYHAMDVFAFASTSETQGMVLTEAMAAGVPVVGLDAPGVREVVRDGENGRLLMEESAASFASALSWVAGLSATRWQALAAGARVTAGEFSMTHTAAAALAHYAALVGQGGADRRAPDAAWERARHLAEAEWDILKGLAGAAASALGSPSSHDRGPF